MARRRGLRRHRLRDAHALLQRERANQRDIYSPLSRVGLEIGRPLGRPHLRYRRSFREALEESRILNLPVLASRHKDECGRCRRMRRQVLDDEALVVWANEHVVVVVGHNERLHDSEGVRDPETGRTLRLCPLYPGVECSDHVRIAVDMDTGGGEEGVAHIIRIIRDEMNVAMALTGKRRLSELGPDVLDR